MCPEQKEHTYIQIERKHKYIHKYISTYRQKEHKYIYRKNTSTYVYMPIIERTQVHTERTQVHTDCRKNMYTPMVERNVEKKMVQRQKQTVARTYRGESRKQEKHAENKNRTYTEESRKQEKRRDKVHADCGEGTCRERDNMQ